MNMIEKVARAIARSDSSLLLPWDRLHDSVKADFRLTAKAAIEAMREPTSAMKMAGSKRKNAHYIGAGIRAGVPNIWQAMIDAALEE